MAVSVTDEARQEVGVVGGVHASEGGRVLGGVLAAGLAEPERLINEVDERDGYCDQVVGGRRTQLVELVVQGASVVAYLRARAREGVLIYIMIKICKIKIYKIKIY